MQVSRLNSNPGLSDPEVLPVNQTQRTMKSIFEGNTKLEGCFVEKESGTPPLDVNSSGGSWKYKHPRAFVDPEDRPLFCLVSS